MYRQGDVLLIKVGSYPVAACEKVQSGIVMYGEATGHAHRITGGEVRQQAGGPLYVIAGADTKLVHDEHDTIHLPEGIYRVRRQREFDGEQIRYVYD